MSAQTSDLGRILELIGRIADTTTDGDYIYRGEPKHYEQVSSSLWRECKKVFGPEEFDIEGYPKANAGSGKRLYPRKRRV